MEAKYLEGYVLLGLIMDTSIWKRGSLDFVACQSTNTVLLRDNLTVQLGLKLN